MTDFKTLIREGAEASQLMAPGDARDLIARLTTALEEVHEVAVGADHTAAKYWRRMREAEVAAGVAEDGVKRAQAEALREHGRVIAYWERGNSFRVLRYSVDRLVADLNERADQIEKEAGA